MMGVKFLSEVLSMNKNGVDVFFHRDEISEERDGLVAKWSGPQMQATPDS